MKVKSQPERMTTAGAWLLSQFSGYMDQWAKDNRSAPQIGCGKAMLTRQEWAEIFCQVAALHCGYVLGDMVSIEEMASFYNDEMRSGHDHLDILVEFGTMIRADAMAHLEEATQQVRLAKSGKIGSVDHALALLEGMLETMREDANDQ